MKDTPIDIQSFANRYQNISFPLLLVMFDNKTDKGSFIWIKEPKEDGSLLLDVTKKNMDKLDDKSLNEIVREVKRWYAHQHVSLE